MVENELQITESKSKDGTKTYKNIKLGDMADGDSIVVTKKFEKAYEGQATANGKTFTSYRTSVTYKGTEVGVFLPSNEEFIAKFNEAGGEGSNIKITVHKKIGKDQKGNDRVFTTYDLDKV